MFENFFTKIRTGAAQQWAALIAFLRSASFRELLLWCLPALLIGFLARLALTIHFPYGYLQADTADYLITTERLMGPRHALVLHGKKSFLTPILFTIPFLLHIPALIIIPLAQHLLGLVLTVISGALVREWFRFWKWFIIPATLLTTLNPAMLWYEHAMLAENHYVFCAITLALAGTIFVAKPTNTSFAWLLVAMLFTAGSRPEGKLFDAFVLLVVALVYFGDMRVWMKKFGIAVVACALIWCSSRSSQAGLLLYATLLPLAPDVSKVAPDFSPIINPLRDTYRAQGETVRSELTTAEKTISNTVDAYWKTKGFRGENGKFCQKLAVEAALNKPLLLPVIAVNKFLQSLSAPTSGGYTEYWVQKKQQLSFTRKKWLLHLMKGITGHELHNNEEIFAFIKEKYPPLNPDWFGSLQHAWDQMTLRARITPDRHYPGVKVCGLPLFFALAAAGMLVAVVRPDRFWKFHFPWVLTLCGLWMVVLLTGVVNSRYRFVFEPFCVFYALFFFDALAALVFKKRTADNTALPQ